MLDLSLAVAAALQVGFATDSTLWAGAAFAALALLWRPPS